MCLTYCAVGIRSLIMTRTPLWILNMFAVPSYPCVLILSRNSQYLLKQFNTIFHQYFHLPLEKQEIPLPPVHSTNLTHMETCSCVDTSVLHHKLKQSIQGYYTLLQCLTYHFTANFDYLVLYIWRCVFYYLIELETLLSRWYCSIS